MSELGQPLASTTKRARPIVLIPTALIEETDRLLTSPGARSHEEEILYWAGVESLGTWVILLCIRPRASRTRGSFRTTADANAEVIHELAEHRLHLLAQVHSHPDQFVDHSEGDDAGAFMPFENFISIVVPHYGDRGVLPLAQCGVHRMESGVFRRLAKPEVERSLRVVPGVRDLRSSA